MRTDAWITIQRVSHHSTNSPHRQFARQEPAWPKPAMPRRSARLDLEPHHVARVPAEPHRSTPSSWGHQIRVQVLGHLGSDPCRSSGARRDGLPTNPIARGLPAPRTAPRCPRTAPCRCRGTGSCRSAAGARGSSGALVEEAADVGGLVDVAGGAPGWVSAPSFMPRWRWQPGRRERVSMRGSSERFERRSPGRRTVSGEKSRWRCAGAFAGDALSPVLFPERERVRQNCALAENSCNIYGHGCSDASRAVPVAGVTVTLMEGDCISCSAVDSPS